MMQLVFDKTEKGREEIATRRYQLPSRIRSILLLVDGKTTGEALLAKFATIGVTGEVLEELLAGEFIASHQGAVAETEAGAPPVSSPGLAPPAQPVATDLLQPGQTQYAAIYQFFSEAIKSNLGLRGYALQLKVEKCGSIDDFRELRTPFLEAVLKSRDTETALGLRDRIDSLLNMKPAPEDAVSTT